MSAHKKSSIETQLIHAGEPRPQFAGAVVTPIFQSSTYLCDPEKGYHDNRYIRLNNTPNHDVLHAKLAALEEGEAAIVMSSGMAAITTTLLTVLGAGDHLLAQNNLYGGTHAFITHDFEHFGIQYTLVDANDPASWAHHVRPNTRAFYCETITNPLIEVGDLAAIARFARERNLVSIIDNTFATPVNFKPIVLGRDPKDPRAEAGQLADHPRAEAARLASGFDLVVHSCTKFLNGHNDLVAGAVVGTREMIDRIRVRLNHLGGSLDPHACFLLNRGLKTLAVRVRYQNESALRIAQFLESHQAVVRVNYAGLESHRQHRRARELFKGYGGILSFELKGGGPAADRLLARVKIPLTAWSLGGVESLITQPARTTHASMSAEARAQVGITDGLIRLSVGLESTDDLIADLDQALRA